MRFLSFVLLFAITLVANAQGKKKFYIADRKADCLGEVAKCIQIRESKKENWRSLPTKIEGFNYEEGFEYRIQIEKVKPDAADGLANFKLVKILSKKKTDYNPAEKLAGREWFVHVFYHDTTFIKLKDTTALSLTFDIKNGRVKMKGICNSMNASVFATTDSIAIGDIMSTKVACAGNTLEDILKSMLRLMNRYEITGNTLTLYYPQEKDRMILKAVIKN